MLTAGRKLRDLLEQEGRIRAVGGGVAEGEFEIAVGVEDEPGVAEAKANLEEVRSHFNRAIMRFRASVTLEPRAHVAWHELSNALWEFSLLFPGEELAPLPPKNAQLWAKGEKQRLAAKGITKGKSTSKGKVKKDGKGGRRKRSTEEGGKQKQEGKRRKEAEGKHVILLLLRKTCSH